MRKPSIFNSDYHKIMRRRKIVFRTLVILVAVGVIFVTYNKSAIPNLRKFAGDIKSSAQDSIAKLQKSVFQKSQNNKEDNVGDETDQSNLEEQNKQEEQAQQQPQVVTGEYIFKFPINESFSILYEKQGEDIKITGIKPENIGISYDIRDDGKAIVFDNPRSSDIWIFNVDGSSRKLNPDNYKEFTKAKIMERYKNNYVWAARPKFLKDGRIVYQSNLPWFLKVNTYYLWIVNSDGTNNRMILSTNQTDPVNYSGYTSDGRLIIEIKGTKYTFNPENRTKQKIQ